jgi:hypothetical protein
MLMQLDLLVSTVAQLIVKQIVAKIVQLLIIINDFN